MTAHRGDAEGFRENTLPAIRSAVAMGANHIEFDLQMTSDGEVIVVHDPTLNRLWHVQHRVSDVLFADVVAIGDADHRPPPLREVLSAIAGSGSVALIDVNDLSIVAPALAVVGESDCQVAWCGDLEMMREVRRLDSGARIWMPWRQAKPPTTGDLADLAPEAINTRAFLASESFTAAVHALGLRLSVWTVDNPWDMAMVIAAGVDHVTSNRPALLHQIISGDEEDMTAPSRFAKELGIARGLGGWAIDFTRAADISGVHSKKDPADLVTDVDMAVEKYVREVIGAHFPDHDFVGEEMGGSSHRDAPCWYLDPVDGTANLANGVPWTAFSLALVVDGEPVVGVVADPWREELFSAERGEGAWRNDVQLQLSPAPVGGEIVDPLRGRIVSTELANQFPWTGMLPMLHALGERFCTLRIMGSGTMTVVGVAAGRGVGAVIGRFGPVDHLAAVLIVSEAGGVVLDQSGAANLFPSSGGILAATPAAAVALHEVWTDAIQASEAPDGR
ncbi:MAG: inositol monophosphatase family protein [Arachnia sp.]